MLMTLLGREAPEMPPEVMFSDLELAVLTAHAKKKPQPTRQFSGCGEIGGKDRRLSWSLRRSVSWTSNNVAGILAIKTYV